MFGRVEWPICLHQRQPFEGWRMERLAVPTAAHEGFLGGTQTGATRPATLKDLVDRPTRGLRFRNRAVFLGAQIFCAIKAR